MISCEIIQDLLPAYASGDCSDETKKVVEEHLKTCKKCNETLEAMIDPVIPAEDQKDPNYVKESAKDMSFKKGFKKIRRKWILSIVCILLIFPLSGLGLLGYNDYKGEGYAYSNLQEVMEIRSFLECLKNKDYEGAFAYIDVKGLYDSVTTTYFEGSDDFAYGYFYYATIGGEEFYVSQSKDLGPYRDYSKEGTDAEIWADIIKENAVGMYQTPIPEKSFAVAKEKYEAASGEDVVVIEPDSETPNGDYTYLKFMAVDGEIYYKPTKNGRASEPDWKNRVQIVSEKIYQMMKSDVEMRREQVQAKADLYRDLGLDAYTKAIKENFIQTFQSLDEKGITAYNYNIGSPRKQSLLYSGMEYVSKNDDWCYDVDIQVSADKNQPMESIILRINEGKIEIFGKLFYESSTQDQRAYMSNMTPYPLILEENYDPIGTYAFSY